MPATRQSTTIRKRLFSLPPPAGPDRGGRGLGDGDCWPDLAREKAVLRSGAEVPRPTGSGYTGERSHIGPANLRQQQMGDSLGTSASTENKTMVRRAGRAPGGRACGAAPGCPSPPAASSPPHCRRATGAPIKMPPPPLLQPPPLLLPPPPPSTPPPTLPPPQSPIPVSCPLKGQWRWAAHGGVGPQKSQKTVRSPPTQWVEGHPWLVLLERPTSGRGSIIAAA